MFASRSMLRIFSKSQLCTGFRNTKVLFRRRVAGFLAGRRDCAPHRRCAVGKTRANKTAACARSPLCIHSLHTPVAIIPCLYVYLTFEEQKGCAYVRMRARFPVCTCALHGPCIREGGEMERYLILCDTRPLARKSIPTSVVAGASTTPPAPSS
jgi:hypothetical protein